MSEKPKRKHVPMKYRTAFKWVLVLLCCAFIVFYSRQPEDSLPSFIITGKYGIHFIEYMVLALLLVNAINMPWRHGWQIAVIAMAVTALIGVGDEMVQAFSAGRLPRVYDWTIDAMGGVLGALIGTWGLSTTWLISITHQRWKRQKKRAIENNDTFDTY